MEVVGLTDLLRQFYVPLDNAVYFNIENFE